MSSDEYCLYVALYVRHGNPTMPGKEDTYHWALLVGPKIESPGRKGIRYHAKEIQKEGGGSEWFWEGRECPLTPTKMLLVRVLVSKIADRDRLAQILHAIPIRQNKRGWNCVAWVREALERLTADGTALCTRIEWETVRKETMRFCQRKTDHYLFRRQMGLGMTKAVTYDLVRRREI
ncbi:hypothetical protein BDW69DRAFT_203385 [Aspergillus filifer]